MPVDEGGPGGRLTTCGWVVGIVRRENSNRGVTAEAPPRAGETGGPEWSRAAQRVAPLCLGRMLARIEAIVEPSSAHASDLRHFVPDAL